jgi:hypothetical protein
VSASCRAAGSVPWDNASGSSVLRKFVDRRVGGQTRDRRRGRPAFRLWNRAPPLRRAAPCTAPPGSRHPRPPAAREAGRCSSILVAAARCTTPDKTRPPPESRPAAARRAGRGSGSGSHKESRRRPPTRRPHRPVDAWSLSWWGQVAPGRRSISRDRSVQDLARPRARHTARQSPSTDR